MQKMKTFGLDFGTTNSSLSMAENGQSQILPIDLSALDPRVVRSMLYFARRELKIDPKISFLRRQNQLFNADELTYVGEQQFLVGQQAVEAYLNDNKNRTPGIKRTIFTGRWIRMKDNPDQPKSDAVPEYYVEIDYGTGRLLQALKSSLRTLFKGTTVFGQYYTVEELISTFITQIKTAAEAQIDQKITQIKVGRPVHFSDDPMVDQRAQSRLEDALKKAGFEDITFEFEPVAAARQYLLSQQQEMKEGDLIFVFDFGGGTLDTALVKMGKHPEVLATDGVYIGGDLLNANIMQAKLWDYFGFSATWGDDKLVMPTHIYEALNSWFSIPNLNNPDTMHSLQETLMYKNSNPEALKRLIHLIKLNLGFELYESIEKAKKELSTQEQSHIIFKDGPIDLDIKIDRQEFEKIIQPRVDEVEEVVKRTLLKAGVQAEDISKVVRTGGSSLIPVFEQMLQKTFGPEKITLFETFTSIAAGLALEVR